MRNFKDLVQNRDLIAEFKTEPQLEAMARWAIEYSFKIIRGILPLHQPPSVDDDAARRPDRRTLS